MNEVWIVWFDSRLLGEVFHGVYESYELAQDEVARMEAERPRIEYWAENIKMNSSRGD